MINGGNMHLDKKGFTLIEVIVVAGIIAILAGILIPIIFKEIDEAKITRAQADVKSISTAIAVMQKDTGQKPNKEEAGGGCLESITMLRSSGVQPNLGVSGFSDSNPKAFSDYLNLNPGVCYSNWKGPYMADVTADPWGRMYITNVIDFAADSINFVWLLSAGPNGIVETQVSSDVLMGDDIGIRLK